MIEFINKKIHEHIDGVRHICTRCINDECRFFWTLIR